jgi:hypothetical protein
MKYDPKDLDRLSDNQLRFLNKYKLDDDQLAIALAVDKEARAQKINPDFVWPMIYQESKFIADAKSPKGAYGVMQLMEDTAESLKVDRYDVNQNIRGGISLLKELTSNEKIGNDPYKVLAGYNARTETRNKFYKSGSLDDLPDETLKHMHSVTKYYGGDLPDVNFAQSDSDQQTTEDTKETTSAEPIKEAEQLKEPPAPTDDLSDKIPKALIGGLGGATVAGSIESGRRVLPIISNVFEKFADNESYQDRPQSQSSLQRYANKQLGHDLRVPLVDLEKITGKPIRSQSEVQSAIDQIKAKPRKPMVNPRTGKPMSGFTAGKPQIDLSAYKYKPTFLQKVADEAKDVGTLVKGALPSVGRVGVGALGGALAMLQLDDAVKQYQKEGKEKGETWHVPSLRNAAQFSGVAGGALSTIPSLPTQLIGAGLTGISLLPDAYDAALEMNERRKRASKEDTDRMLMNVDSMGNPL